MSTVCLCTTSVQLKFINPCGGVKTITKTSNYCNKGQRRGLIAESIIWMELKRSSRRTYLLRSA